MRRLNDESLLRVLIFVGASLAAIIGATGETAQVVFHQPNFLKYLISTGAPLFVALIVVTKHPMRLIVCAAIFVTPVQFVATLAGVEVTPMEALMVMATPLALMSSREGRRPGWLGPAAAIIVVLLLPGMIIGTSTGSYLWWIAETLWLAYLVYITAREGGQRAILWAFALTALVQSLIALYEAQTHHILNLYSGTVAQTASSSNYFFSYGNVTRPYGTFNDPISLGDVLCITVPLLMMLAIKERHWAAKLGASVIALLTSLAAIATYSRASWIGVVVGVLVCTALLPGRQRARTAVAVAVAAVAVVVLALSTGGKELEHRISSVINPTNIQSKYAGTARTDRARERGWSAAIEVIGDNPLGTGFGKLNAALNLHGLELNNVGNAQSWYLEIGGEAGVLGLAALAVLIVAAFRDLFVAWTRDRVLVAAGTASVIAMLIGWVTDVTTQFIAVSGMIAAFMALLAAAAGSRARTQTSGASRRPVFAGPFDVALAGVPSGAGPRPASVFAAIRPVMPRKTSSQSNGSGAANGAVPPRRPTTPPDLEGEIGARRGSAPAEPASAEPSDNGHSSNGFVPDNGIAPRDFEPAAPIPEPVGAVPETDETVAEEWPSPTAAPLAAAHEPAAYATEPEPEAELQPEPGIEPEFSSPAASVADPEPEHESAGGQLAPEPPVEVEPPLLIIVGDDSRNAVFNGLGVPFEPREVPDAIKSGDPDPVKAIRKEALSRAARAVQVGDNEVCVAAASRIRLRSFGLKAPEDPDTARLLLHTISGQSHEVLSAVAVVWAGGVKTSVTSTEVAVRRLSATEVERYVDSGEWRGTATGYDVNGLGAGLLESVNGDFQNLSGVPLESLEEVYPAIFEAVD